MQAAGILPYCPKTGRYLIAKRGPDISNPNQWTNFGGKANKGENPTQTAVREFKEESGYKGSVRLNRPIPTKNNKDGMTFYNFIGEVPAEFQPTTIGKKTVDGDVEVSASKWVTKEQLIGLIGNSILHPGFNMFLNLKFKQEESNMKNINYVKKMIRESILKEFYSDDRKFEVFESRLKAFTDELKKHKLLKIINKEKDGGYYNIKVFNSGPADAWDSFTEFYKTKIKI